MPKGWAGLAPLRDGREGPSRPARRGCARLGAPWCARRRSKDAGLRNLCLPSETEEILNVWTAFNPEKPYDFVRPLIKNSLSLNSRK